MKRGFVGFLIVGVALMLAAGADAQQPVPEARFVASRDVDFYGSDLDALFDTTLGACAQTCAAQKTCVAFTFNRRSNACFPKSAITKREPYEGAISARKVQTDPAVLRAAGARAERLSFLVSPDLERAAGEARDVGLRHPAGALTLDEALSAMQARRQAGDMVMAAAWAGAAVSISDRADLWADYARFLLAIETDRRSDRRRHAGRAVSAATNAFLRAQSDGGQVSALQVLAQALERVGRGRDMIGALRLASEIQAREDIVADLDAAIAKYGFRITDTTVESDAARPRICAEFSEPLVKAGVDYAPFVRLPQNGLAVQVDGRQLCLDGVEHGQRYRFTLRRGLPAASGETLHKDVELIQYVRDRSPSVRFPGRSYVLPKAADAALPVETVNLTRLELVLRRVSDRNLVSVMREGFFARPLAYWQDQQFSEGMAEEVWKGTAEVESELNRDMTSRLPMGEAIAGQPAGIYALTARVPGVSPYEQPGATQWFVLSDMGLSTMQGTDGLHVAVRGLSDAKPVEGVEVSLISRANAVLAVSKTDAGGNAAFAPGLTRGTGSAAPALVVARQSDSDIGFLSLTEPAFDLSDRGVEGRAPAGPLDVFLTTDRGAYRAGETIHVTALVRDGQAKSVEGVPALAVLRRPDGVEYSRQLSRAKATGGHIFSLPLGTGVPRGTWKLEVFGDPEAPSLASTELLVEDFLPERIDFELSLPDAPLRPGDTPPLTIAARYLFGAPGSDLAIDGQVSLRPSSQVDGWNGFVFGRHDERVGPRSDWFGGARTGVDGAATLALKLPDLPARDRPLEATVTVRLADGAARPVERRITAPVRPAGPVIGLRAGFDEVVPEGTEASFDLIGLSPELKPHPMKVRWTLNRVETRYQWYQLYGDWNWEPITRRTRIATGEAALGETPLALSQPVDWGQYELVVERTDGEYAASSVGFYAGWYAPADASATPDRLEMSLDRESYAPGDTARLRIVPRHGGTALVTVLSDRVISRMAVEVPQGASVIPVEVTDEWGTGAYVTATVIRPMNVASGQNPARALGVAHASVSPGDKALSVGISLPETVTPRSTARVGLSVEGVASGETAYVTVAAVDVGILNLTGFESPDPQGHYFGQRRMGVELRDVYGRLIDGMNGAMGTVRSGGDADSGLRRQSPPPTQDLMAVFSGLIEVGPDGRAEFDVPLPAFNGTVRLMAVAWSSGGVGQAEADMLVRDPVVVSASLPRVLAPGDRSRMLLQLVHADGLAGEMALEIEAEGVAFDATSVPATISLSEGEKRELRLPVTAGEIGDQTVTVRLTMPDGRVLEQSLILPVRANDPVIAQTRRFTLGAGQSFTFSGDVFAGLRPGTAQALISAGPLARFDAPALLARLDRYPYGCTEQVTSQALPLLYLSSVAKATGMGEGPEVAARIDEAISRILARQASNGAFGLWRAGAGDFWLDAYVSDFLSRARAEGHAVPDRAFRLAIDNLRNRINFAPDFDRGGEDIAYALMVLAREGAASMADLRYYADVKGGSFATPLAAAQLGAALADYGDQVRADAMFARAARMIVAQKKPEGSVWRADYGTPLRDAAGVLALAVAAGSDAVDREQLLRRVADVDGPRSTQEAAWALLAAEALIGAPEGAGLLVDGSEVEGPFVRMMQDTSPETVRIMAQSGRSTEVTLTTLGVPEMAPPAGGTGYAITREYFDMEGTPLDGRSWRVGQRFVTVLRVTPAENVGARLIVDDPLPGGIEIDNPSLLRSGDVRALEWLEPSFAEHAEFRSDRFVAAVDLRGGEDVVLAYVARAVTAGEYHHPAASVEDMYRPRYRARTSTGSIQVVE